jgi:hypothetical protein
MSPKSILNALSKLIKAFGFFKDSPVKTWVALINALIILGAIAAILIVLGALRSEPFLTDITSWPEWLTSAYLCVISIPVFGFLCIAIVRSADRDSKTSERYCKSESQDDSASS